MSVTKIRSKLIYLIRLIVNFLQLVTARRILLIHQNGRYYQLRIASFKFLYIQKVQSDVIDAYATA